MIRLSDCLAAVVVFAVCVGGATAAPYNLSTGTGDFSVTVGVSGFGSFGFAGGPDDADASYDPPGPTGPSTTSFESWVAIRVGPTGPRTMLAGPNPAVTGTLTTANSTFTFSGMNFTLVQTLTPLFNAAGTVRTGSVLTQTYTITNPTGATIDFELVRYFVGELLGIIPAVGGRIPGPPEVLWESESPANLIVVGMTSLGGTIPATNRFEINAWSGLATRILAGNPLADIVFGDGNADGVTDSMYDVSHGLRNTFSLAPGATNVYTTHTFFGSGTPGTLFVPPTPPPPPTPPGAPSAGAEGSHSGSKGVDAGVEGCFGLGARSLRGPSALLGPLLHQPGSELNLAKLSPGSRLPSSGVHLTVLNVAHHTAQDAEQVYEDEQLAPVWALTLATVLGSLVLVTGTRYLLR
jgi:hypothetical protein